MPSYRPSARAALALSIAVALASLANAAGAQAPAQRYQDAANALINQYHTAAKETQAAIDAAAQ